MNIFLRVLFPLLLVTFATPCPGKNEPTPAESTLKAITLPIEAKDFEVTLVPENGAIMVGEPIYVSLTVKNVSARAFRIEAQDDFDYLRSSMTARVKLTAVDKAGTKAPTVPEPRGPMISGDLGFRREDRDLPAGGSVTLRLWLPSRIAFDHPASYTLTVEMPVLIFETGMKGWAEVALTASAPLEVLPMDKEKMGQLIDALEKQATAVSHTIYNNEIPPGYQESLDAEWKLSAVNDERVIPYYRRKMLAENYGEWMGAMGALSKFNNDEALDSIKDGLETTVIINPASHKPDAEALRQVHMAACDDLLRSPHPRAAPLLVAQRKNPDVQVRIKVMEVAGKLPQQEAIALLEEMQHDKEKWVGDIARRYLRDIKSGKAAKPGETTNPMEYTD